MQNACSSWTTRHGPSLNSASMALQSVACTTRRYWSIIPMWEGPIFWVFVDLPWLASRYLLTRTRTHYAARQHEVASKRSLILFSRRVAVNGSVARSILANGKISAVKPFRFLNLTLLTSSDTSNVDLIYPSQAQWQSLRPFFSTTGYPWQVGRVQGTSKAFRAFVAGCQWSLHLFCGVGASVLHLSQHAGPPGHPECSRAYRLLCREPPWADVKLNADNVI